MPRPSRKKQKSAIIKRSCVSGVQEQQSTGVKKMVLFGKCVTINEDEQQFSYYAKLRHWFDHAVPEGSEDTPRMGSAASTAARALPSTSRPSQQEADVPPGNESYIFQSIPPPVVTGISPYPILVPFIRNEALPPAILDDPKMLLEHHMTHWKMVRKNWILHRQLYLERYNPCFAFINTTRSSMEE